MARKRPQRTKGSRPGAALAVVSLCLLIGGAAVGYVWQKKQIIELGQTIKQHEVRLAELRNEKKALRDRLSDLRSPRALRTKVRDLGLDLKVPEPEQILKLREPRPGERADEPQILSYGGSWEGDRSPTSGTP